MDSDASRTCSTHPCFPFPLLISNRLKVLGFLCQSPLFIKKATRMKMGMNDELRKNNPEPVNSSSGYGYVVPSKTQTMPITTSVLSSPFDAAAVCCRHCQNSISEKSRKKKVTWGPNDAPVPVFVLAVFPKSLLNIGRT